MKKELDAFISAGRELLKAIDREGRNDLANLASEVENTLDWIICLSVEHPDFVADKEVAHGQA